MEPQFRILGSLGVVGEGTVELGGVRPRRLLAMLLLHAGEAVSADRLVDAVWEGRPPASAMVTLRTHVASLRRGLAAVDAGHLLVTRPPGYRLAVRPEQVDAHRFERLLAEGRAAWDRSDADAAADVLRQALGLWRGAVLADLDGPQFAAAEAARLEELRLEALAGRIDADLALGRHRELVPELESLVEAHPFRERLCGQLMLALYRAGRQVDALAAYRTTRARLDEELGLVPGPTLAGLETAILRHDPALLKPAGAVTPPRSDPGARRPPTQPPDALFDVVRRVAMVGRENELERLQGLWKVVRGGGRRVVLVSGEAGVGKTRLVAELASAASEQGAVVLVGHGEQTALIPYQPVSNALRGNALVTEAVTQAPQQVRDQLAQLLDRPSAPPAEDSPPVPTDDQQAAFLDAAGWLLARLSHRAPTVFVLEDAELIDRASARLLGHLARRLPERMLLVVCFRDPPGSRHLPLLDLLAGLASPGLADRLTLEPLTESDLAALVAAWMGTPAPAGFVRSLWFTTGGNPFFASEVVRDLAARGGIGSDDAVPRVPSGVQDVLRLRLRALSPPAQEAVGCAAVLGREFDASLLALVWSQPIDKVLAALQEAEAAGWLVETERAATTRYAFRHALMRQAVHADVLAPQRQRLHLRAADALEAAGAPGAGTCAAIAVHLRAAGALVDPQRAASASLRAASETAQLYAWDEAVAHAEAAAAILAHACAPPEQQGAAAVQTAEILIRSTTDLPRAIEHLQTALAHYRAAADETTAASVHSQLGQVLALHHSVMDIPAALAHLTAAEAVLTDGKAAFDLHLAKVLATMFGLRSDEGCAASARAVELAANLGRRDLIAQVQTEQAMHELHLGRLATARRCMDEAWATAQALGDPHLGWEATLGAALTDNVYLLDPAAAHRWCRRGLAQRGYESMPLARETTTDHLAYALAGMGRLAEAREIADRLSGEAISNRLLLRLGGDWEAAEQAWAAALEHDLDHGDLLNAGLNAYWLGQVRWQLDPGAHAVDTLRRALTIVRTGPHVPAELMVGAELARRLAALAEDEEAAEHLARCEEILAGGEDWRGRVGHIELARAAVAAVRGQHAHADAAHVAALTVFTTYRLPWWRAETLKSWAGWFAAADRPTDADAKRHAAQQLLDRLGATRATVVSPDRP